VSQTAMKPKSREALAENLQLGDVVEFLEPHFFARRGPQIVSAIYLEGRRLFFRSGVPSANRLYTTTCKFHDLVRLVKQTEWLMSHSRRFES